MKTLVSVAVALAAVPVAAAIAAPSAPPAGSGLMAAVLPASPPSLGDQHLRVRVVRLAARARTRAMRLGLTPGPLTRPASAPEALALQERRLAFVVGFLRERREVNLAVDERPVPSPGRRARAIGDPGLARAYRAVARLARRLGLDRPAPPRASADPATRGGQVAHWRAVARWLARRSEILRPDERPLSARIPHYAALMCIAGHESHGTWDISTGNGYYGGLQMDRGFQQAYAPGLYRTKGTADHWTAEEQMRAAERAIATRGFTPWPNTARMCGVL